MRTTPVRLVLDDFCNRVDLKQVNRRVLECLVKVGAFDAFGHRAQMLEVIDRMLSLSASHHNASNLGQMSMFGELISADTFGSLPNVPAFENKKQLEWEKELMGVYFSQHPLLKLTAGGKKHVSAYVGEITPESDGQQLVIGGIISSTFLTLVLLPTLYEWVERKDTNKTKEPK